MCDVLLFFFGVFLNKGVNAFLCSSCVVVVGVAVVHVCCVGGLRVS